MAGLRRNHRLEWIGIAGWDPSDYASKPASERYLSFAEREDLAILRAQGTGIREIARQIGRAASTISRELRRNAATRSGGLEYRATTAQWHAERAARRPKPAKLAVSAALPLTSLPGHCNPLPVSIPNAGDYSCSWRKESL